jgi:hypothetical protein
MSRRLPARAADALQELSERNAELLRGQSLWDFCSGCQQLTALAFGALDGGISAAGVLPLLTAHKALQCLNLQPAEESSLAGLLPSLRALYPAVEGKWSACGSPQLVYFVTKGAATSPI